VTAAAVRVSPSWLAMRETATGITVATTVSCVWRWSVVARGLRAGQGVATAVVYGMLVVAASLPGAVMLMTAWPGPGAPGPGCAGPRPGTPIPADVGGASRG
jgi:hypothetical protein